MELNHDEFYCFKTQKGTNVKIKKVPEIEKMTSNILEMSDIGKLTDLFWGYNIVDNSGSVFRKFKFLSNYPDKAKLIIRCVYPSFFRMSKSSQHSFRENLLNEKMIELINFTIEKTKYMR